jgi:hypothetical protein
VISGSHPAGFAVISLALIRIPGPNVLLAVSRSLMLGVPAGRAGAADLVDPGVRAIRHRHSRAAALEVAAQPKSIRTSRGTGLSPG